MRIITIAGVLGLLVFTSAVRVFFYYNFFSINIFSFLGGDEILLMTLYSIPYIIPILLIFALLYYKDWTLDWKWKALSSLQKFERIALSSFLQALFLIGFALTAGYFQQTKIKDYGIYIPTIFHYFIFFLFVTIFFLLYLFIKSSKAKNGFASLLLSITSSKIFTIVSVLTVLICLPSVTEIIRAQENKLYKNAEITTPIKTIICNKELFCIGVTKNFVFLFDQKTKTPIIYNMAYVTSFKSDYELNEK